MAEKLVAPNVVHYSEDSALEIRLPRAGTGGSLAVSRVHGDEAFRGKMMALGIVAGSSLRVVQGGGNRPLLVALNGSRLLLDARSAQRISVTKREDPADERGVGS
jgi:Fe2+ transport system protein FeoA